MSADKAAEDILRGQPFIEKIKKYNNPEDLAYGEQIPRACGLCFYRDRPGNITRDCEIIVHEGKKTPKELFGFKPDEYLPAKLDGKEVGNYCPYFRDFRIPF